MHELAICSSLIDEVGRVACARPGHRVVSIAVRVGPLAGVEPGLLAAAFPIASAGTAAAGAQLLFEEAPVRVRCPSCDVESVVPCNRLSCPCCGGWRTELVSGDELLLIRVELERRGEEVSHV
jgi:hydrogenase nickel incorporation protein HypA/HybF